MLKFFRWLFGTRPMPMLPEGWERLSAEKNVLQTIRNKTGRTYPEIRQCLSGVKWKKVRKEGCEGWWYDQLERGRMIRYCIDILGEKK